MTEAQCLTKVLYCLFRNYSYIDPCFRGSKVTGSLSEFHGQVRPAGFLELDLYLLAIRWNFQIHFQSGVKESLGRHH